MPPVLRGEAFSVFLPFPLLAVKLCQVGREQDFSSTPLAFDSFASIFPAVATDLFLGQVAGMLPSPPQAAFAPLGQRDPEADVPSGLCAARVGCLESSALPRLPGSHAPSPWRLREIAGRPMWAPSGLGLPRMLALTQHLRI